MSRSRDLESRLSPDNPKKSDPLSRIGALVGPDLMSTVWLLPVLLMETWIDIPTYGRGSTHAHGNVEDSKIVDYSIYENRK